MTEQVTLAVRTLSNLYLTLEHTAATVFVPFAPPPSGEGAFTIAPSEPEVYLSDDPGSWYVSPTWAVFLEWQRLPEVERQYAEQAFARRRDPRVGLLDEGWFRGAFVYFARQAVQHGLPVLFRFSRAAASAEHA